MEIHNVPFFVKQSFSLILAAGTVFCFFPFYMGELASCFWSWTYFLNTRRRQAWQSKWVARKTLVVFAFEMLCPKNWKQHGLPWKQETNDCAKREKTVLFVVHENLTVTTHATKWTCFRKRKNSVSEKHQLKWSKQQFICVSVLSGARR